MHLLNTLPQRLDPGATPTFAGLIASSLTSPASTNLTLAGGSGNTNVILTPAGTGNVGIGTITPSSALSIFNLNPIIKLQNTTPVNDLGLKFFNGSGTAVGGIVSDGTTGGIFLSPYNFSNALGIAPTTGNVSIASTTASSSAITGALQVAGGIGVAGASYFGANVVARGALGYATGIHSGTTADSSQQLILSSSGAYSNAYVSKNGTTLGIGFSSSNGSFVEDNALSIVAATKAATFAGAVTVSGAVAGLSIGTTTHQAPLVVSNGGANGLEVDPLADTGAETAVFSYNRSTALLTKFRLSALSHNFQVSGFTDAVQISSAAAVRFNAYGAGAATFDSSGNITSVSDARLKNITGTFTKGLAEIVKLTPKLYTWKPETGLVTDDINATLIAQDLIAAGLSEAVTTYRTVAVMEDDVQSAEDIAAGKPVTQHAKLDADGKAVTQRVDSNYSVSDRTVIAALVNAVKELKAEIDALKAK